MPVASQHAAFETADDKVLGRRGEVVRQQVSLLVASVGPIHWVAAVIRRLNHVVGDAWKVAVYAHDAGWVPDSRAWICRNRMWAHKLVLVEKKLSRA